MRPIRPLLHLLALLFALGQGFVPAVAAVADGRLVAAARGDRDVAHIEQLGGSGCHRVHTDACELCRLLSLRAPVAHAPSLVPTTAAGAALAPTSAAASGASADTPFALPRGPPPAA